MLLSCSFSSAVVILVTPGGWHDKAKDIFHPYRGVETLGYDYNTVHGLQHWYRNQLSFKVNHPHITILEAESDMSGYLDELQYQVNEHFKRVRCPKP